MLVLNGESPRQWLAIIVIPALALLLKWIVDQQTQGMAKRGEWRDDVETMRDSWKETWQALSERLKRAEEGEVEWRKRHDRLLQVVEEQGARVEKLEGIVEDFRRDLREKNEAVQVLELEKEMLEKELRKAKPASRPNEDGDPK